MMPRVIDMLDGHEMTNPYLWPCPTCRGGEFYVDAAVDTLESVSKLRCLQCNLVRCRGIELAAVNE